MSVSSSPGRLYCYHLELVSEVMRSHANAGQSGRANKLVSGQIAAGPRRPTPAASVSGKETRTLPDPATTEAATAAADAAATTEAPAAGKQSLFGACPLAVL